MLDFYSEKTGCLEKLENYPFELFLLIIQNLILILRIACVIFESQLKYYEFQIKC